MNTNNYIKKIKSLWIRIIIKFREKTYDGRLKYLFFNRHSDSIIIVFSGFTGIKPKYNYIKSFESLNIDRLYILDDFGYMGSYYWYEDGKDKPRKWTEGLLNKVLSRGYNHVYFAGSSKGGTCSIYYGLQFNAELIFSGACQYNVGTYVSRPGREDIFKGMMGKNADKTSILLLDQMMPIQFEKHSGSKSVIHLIYSKNELTYQRQIIDLLVKASECNLQIVEHVETFSNHDEIGLVFPSKVLSLFKNL